MFDRLKSVFGANTSAPAQALNDFFLPLKALEHSTAAPDGSTLFDRCVAYVFDGDHAPVILELDGRADSEAANLMGTAGRLTPWSRASSSVRPQLEKLGLTEGKAEENRSAYYSSNQPTVPQWVRLGRVLTVIGEGPNRTVKGVPLWLTALVNDLAMSCPRPAKDPEKIAALRGEWTPDRLAALLAHEGEDAARIPEIVVQVLFQRDQDLWGRLFPDRLPGIDDYLLAHGAEISPASVSLLAAAGRASLAERAAANPAVADALAQVVGALSVDTGKTVRAPAIKALHLLSDERRGEVLAPVLAKVPASRAGEVVEYLGRTPHGKKLLGDAVAAGSKIAVLAAQVNDRMQVLDAADAMPEEFELPAFEPLPDTVVGEETAAEIRAHLAATAARMDKLDSQWAKKNAARARSVTDSEIKAVLKSANGQGESVPKLLEKFNLWWLSEGVPSLSLVHLLRLERSETNNLNLWRLRRRIESDTDLRVIADALARAGYSELDAVRCASNEFVSPQAAWPWFSQHLDVLQEWLSRSETTERALLILGCFPHVPKALLPAVAAVAVGDSKRNRPLAQAALSTHPAAVGLAEQALTDSLGDVRAAAAEWLARLDSTQSIGALRAAFSKERREVVKAALLTSLETLGDDISSDLSPDLLRAEALKGLKPKAPASMEWFPAEQLPAVRWSDGTPVDAEVLRWWVVLAVKLKNPDGTGLLDRYLGLLHADDAADVGRYMLRAWIAQDTRHPSDEECHAYAQKHGPARWARNQDWLKRAQANTKHPEWLPAAQEAAAIPVEKLIAQAYAEHQAVCLGSAAPDKGMLALTTRMPGIELANAVQAYVRSYSGRRAQIEMLVIALYGNGDPAAVQLLLSMSRRHRQVTVQARARELVETIAESRGWTSDELADRTIPSAGFADDGLLHLDYGSRQFVGRITAAGTIQLTTDEGKPVKALPAARAAEDKDLVKEAKKQLSTARKELKSVLELQTSRLYEAMCTGRTWAVADWQEFLAGHPIVAQLIGRLVWVEDPDGVARTFRPTEDGSLIDLGDEPIELSPGARIGIGHRVTLGAETSDAWLAHVDDYGVEPLFAQLANALPEIPAGAVVFDGLAGHMTDTFSFRGVAGKRGYVRGSAEDGGWFSEYTKPFASARLSAVLEFTGSIVPEENFACATESLSFRRGSKTIPIDQVPPILVAECYADYVAVAALGPFDPDYRKKAVY